MPEAKAALDKNRANNDEDLNFPNHEYMTGSFSSRYTSRNRVRKWNEQPFAIQATEDIFPAIPKQIP